MEWIFRYQLFLFDFDGLLVDTEPLHFEAYRQMCCKRGFTLDWDFQRFCRVAHAKASGMRDGVYAEFPALQAAEPRWEVLYQEKKEAYEQLLKTRPIELMPGAAELLMALDQAGINRCVVTNSPMKQIAIIREVVPLLKTIPQWLTRESYQNPKPAPDGYLKAIELFGADPAKTVGFEDSLKGLQSLLAAKVTGVLVCPLNSPQVAECSSLGAMHAESFSKLSL